jgi:hypothetical protein
MASTLLVWEQRYYLKTAYKHQALSKKWEMRKKEKTTNSFSPKSLLILGNFKKKEKKNQL